MDLRLFGKELEGRRFKTKINESGFQGERHVWNKRREFVIDEIYPHHVLCTHTCAETGEKYKESFSTADLIALGILKGKE